MKDPRMFGDTLRQLRTSRGLTQEGLAELFGVHRRTISGWEVGSTSPTHKQVTAIVELFASNEEEMTELLGYAGYKPSATSVTSTEPSQDGSADAPGELPPPVPLQGSYRHYSAPLFSWSDIIEKRNAVANAPGDATIRELKVQMMDIQAALEAVRADVASPSPDTPLLEDVQNAMDALRQAQQTAGQIKARVILTSQEDMDVRLVPASSFDRLEEYRSEESKWFSTAGVLFGAIIGIFISIATGGQLKTETLILVIVFAILCRLSWWTARTYQERERRIKDSITSNGSVQPGKEAKDGEAANVRTEK